MRNMVYLGLLALIVAPAAAQDMPLSQILIDGEGWRAVEKTTAPKFPLAAEATSRKGQRYVSSAIKHEPLVRPSCAVLWPDESQLVVGDAEGKYLWAFRVESDGRLGAGDRYYSLRVQPGQPGCGVSALTFDNAGRLYACTTLGVQVFDPTGRLSGVLLKPADAPLTAITFGGPDHDQLFVACGDKVYARKLKSKGATAPAK